MNINLHIEKLVLEGIDLRPAQRQHLQDALETELGRLLAQGGIPGELAAGGALPSLRANGFEMSSGRDPVQLGQQIARSVYGGLGQ